MMSKAGASEVIISIRILFVGLSVNFVQLRACRANGISCGDGEIGKGAETAFVSDGNRWSRALPMSKSPRASTCRIYTSANLPRSPNPSNRCRCYQL